MSRTYRKGERHIRARGIRQDPPDLRRIARTLIALVEAQAEAEAQALVEDPVRSRRPKPRSIAVPESASSADEGSKEVA